MAIIFASAVLKHRSVHVPFLLRSLHGLLLRSQNVHTAQHGSQASSLLQPHWLPCYFSDMTSILWPQGLCTYYSSCRQPCGLPLLLLSVFANVTFSSRPFLTALFKTEPFPKPPSPAHPPWRGDRRITFCQISILLSVSALGSSSEYIWNHPEYLLFYLFASFSCPYVWQGYSLPRPHSPGGTGVLTAVSPQRRKVSGTSCVFNSVDDNRWRYSNTNNLAKGPLSKV